MLKKVISGAQQGVDIAALKAARTAGIPTGGYCPKGCRTTDGDRPELIAMFDLTEMESRYYTKRTEANVRAADATLVLAWNVQSPGTRLTRRLVREAKKPGFTISSRDIYLSQVAAQVSAWIHSFGIETLNIAGNSEMTAPGIGEWAEGFLREVFTACRRDEDA